jgi:hypothetical protein
MDLPETMAERIAERVFAMHRGREQRHEEDPFILCWAHAPENLKRLLVDVAQEALEYAVMQQDLKFADAVRNGLRVPRGG